MTSEGPPATSFSAGRKWGILLSVLLSIVSVVALVVMINYLATRYLHQFRFSLSTRGTTQLSPQTLGLIRSITNHVNIVCYFDKEDDLYGPVSTLLDQYGFASPNITVEKVDYALNPTAADKIKKEFGLGSAEDKNLVIFECEGRWKAVESQQLGVFSLDPVGDPKERKFRKVLKSFQGEMWFTAALLNVTHPKPLKAYFLQLHGEHNPDSEVGEGYSKFAEVLKQSNVQWDKLELIGTNTVPADCSLLIIAGPQRALMAEEHEQDKLAQYLAQGGRMLMLFDVATLGRITGLESIMAGWGVDVGTELVRDPRHSASPGRDIVVENFNHQHPMVNPLLDGNVQLFYPRAIQRLEGAKDAPDAPHVEELAWSGEPAYLGNSTIPVGRQVPLMVAVEKGNEHGVFNERGTTRIVVVGDSMFLENLAITQVEDNRTFAVCAINWLLDQTELLQGVGPRRMSEYRFVMTDSQMQSVAWLFLAGMPGAILCLGAVVWLRRRH
jgi:hypothetical protein